MVPTEEQTIKRLTHPRCGVCKRTKPYDQYIKLSVVLVGKFNRGICLDCETNPKAKETMKRLISDSKKYKADKNV